MKNTITSFAIRAVWHLIPLLAAVVVIMGVKALDQSIPVITDFKVLHQALTPNGVMIDGIMNKRRNCTFEALSAYADETTPVHVRFTEQPVGFADSSRAVRVQLWGPWEILSGNAKTIEMYAQHRCHMFWSSSSLLIKYTVLKVNENGTTSSN